MPNRTTHMSALIALVFAAACNDRGAPATTLTRAHDLAATQHELETYQVPTGHEKRIARLLAASRYPLTVAGEGGAEARMVRLDPQFTGDGYFVLSAPAGIHKGVRELIDVVAATKPRGGPPAVRIDYWLVLGWPAAETAVGARLAEVTPALDALSALGPMRFELLESLGLATLDGEHGVARGRLATVKHTASLDTDTVELRLEIEVESSERRAVIQTALTLRPGQFAVLGQAGYAPMHRKLAPDDATPTLFYLARAQGSP